MIRTASPHDLPALRDMFAQANDGPYDLAAVAEEKCFGDGLAGSPATRVFERDGRMAGVAVTCGEWLRILVVDREMRRQGIGSALLADSGASVIAAEPGNYFTPGVWTEDFGSRAFFTAHGYVEKREVWNLIWSAGAPAPAFQGDGVAAPRHVKAVAGATALQTFIEREFGPAWRFEAARARGAFIAEVDGVIAGFAVYEANNRGLGTFGPTGVAKAFQGRRIGWRLLRAALAAIHDLGYEHAIIPWTDALAYYRKCANAKPAHRFVAFARPGP